ncbi:MAG TPA: amino acid racemase [Acidimicrobiales bacterium]
MKRIGLIGGLSWESTASYYALLNQLTAQQHGSWKQPLLMIDSVDFSEIVALQRAGDWTEATKVMVDSALRLEAGGATVLAICANTMHISYDEIAGAVSIPVIDIRDALVTSVRDLGGSTLILLATKYVMEGTFFTEHIERLGLNVVIPQAHEMDELQSMIYDELTQGIVRESSRSRFMEIASNCQARGGDVVGLCCTEFGLYVNGDNAPWPYVDSTLAHVKTLLRF